MATKTEIKGFSKVEYCAGSGRKIKNRNQGYKVVQWSRKWQCNQCGGWYALDKNSCLNRHGKKKTHALSMCAECGTPVWDELHYLCESCRV